MGNAPAGGGGMTTQVLNRSTFETSRVMEFFSAKELQMQIGHAPEMWPLALVRELIDNALDACESARIAPVIEVSVGEDAASVRDNGPGLPDEVLARSLDYLVRVSDKSHYVSPTRGQMGNALKCVWAAPFVADGQCGRVEVSTGGKTHMIDVRLDRIAQKPKLSHAVREDGIVKNGTLVKMHWSGIGLLKNEKPFFDIAGIELLLVEYAAWNPHARFCLFMQSSGQHIEIAPTAQAWSKWLPSRPTSPHWYTPGRLEALIAAYIAQDRDAGKSRSVREFVSEFDGLSASAKQKAVTDAINLTGAPLSALVKDGDVDGDYVRRLLGTMKHHARPVKPASLGVIGEAHLTRIMPQLFGVTPESIRYKKVEEEEFGLPLVVEVAFGVRGSNEGGRQGCAGLNWTPCLTLPFSSLAYLLGAARVDEDDPVVILVHVACPRLEFEDRGKARVTLTHQTEKALSICVRSVTKSWTEEKRHADRQGRLRASALERLRKAQKPKEITIKEAAYQVMEEAYLMASGNKQLPANARQIMYAARSRVLALIGKSWENSSYFTQTLLPDFMEASPELTADWDVVYDSRGRFVEPHTDKRVDLGTLAVRRYIGDWHAGGIDLAPEINIDHSVATCGPQNRYRFALFIEKEGFYPVLKRV
jgi:DNA topoisomerase VI subunit B